MVKDYHQSDNRAFNISLMASLFTVILITIIELIVDVLNAYNLGITPFLAKVLIIIIVSLFLKNQWKDWNKERKR